MYWISSLRKLSLNLALFDFPTSKPSESFGGGDDVLHAFVSICIDRAQFNKTRNFRCWRGGMGMFNLALIRTMSAKSWSVMKLKSVDVMMRAYSHWNEQCKKPTYPQGQCSQNFEERDEIVPRYERHRISTACPDGALAARFQQTDVVKKEVIHLSLMAEVIHLSLMAMVTVKTTMTLELSSF